MLWNGYTVILPKSQVRPLLLHRKTDTFRVLDCIDVGKDRDAKDQGGELSDQPGNPIRFYTESGMKSCFHQSGLTERGLPVG